MRKVRYWWEAVPGVLFESWSRRAVKRFREYCLDQRFVVGPVYGGDGTTPATGRQGKTGESIVAQVNGKYYEDCSRGVLFGASDNTTGITVTVALSTTAIVSLYMPPNCKARATPVKLRTTYFSGTMPAGSLYHCFASGLTAPSSGTAPAIFCCDSGYEAGAAPQAVFRYAPTVVAPTAGNALIVPAYSSFPQLASTANPFQALIEDFDGEFVLEPGAQYQLQAVCGGAGSSPKVSVGLTWRESPYVASQG